MEINNVLRQWARLGIMFNVRSAVETPDVEKLLIDTAVILPRMPRLLPACVTWLTHFERFVCRHRLAALASHLQGSEDSAALGLLLTLKTQFVRTDHFNLAVSTCRPLKTPKPLFSADRLSPALSKMARDKSMPLGRKWGLWCDPIVLKEDVIRPLSWVMRYNPSLKQRAIFNGNLRASILETLTHNAQAGENESLLARRCYATRKAVREALDHLEFCQLVARQSSGRKVLISLC